MIYNSKSLLRGFQNYKSYHRLSLNPRNVCQCCRSIYWLIQWSSSNSSYSNRCLSNMAIRRIVTQFAFVIIIIIFILIHIGLLCFTGTTNNCTTQQLSQRATIQSNRNRKRSEGRQRRSCCCCYCCMNEQRNEWDRATANILSLWRLPKDGLQLNGLPGEWKKSSWWWGGSTTDNAMNELQSSFQWNLLSLQQPLSDLLFSLDVCVGRKQ